MHISTNKRSMEPRSRQAHTKNQSMGCRLIHKALLSAQLPLPLRLKGHASDPGGVCSQQLVRHHARRLAEAIPNARCEGYGGFGTGSGRLELGASVNTGSSDTTMRPEHRAAESEEVGARRCKLTACRRAQRGSRAPARSKAPRRGCAGGGRGRAGPIGPPGRGAPA